MPKKKIEHTPTEVTSPVKPKVKTWKKVLRWVGWGVIYVVAFYLGNLSGEYVASQMPLVSLSVPHVASPTPPNVGLMVQTIKSYIPRVSVSWKGLKFASAPPAANTPVTTQTIVLNGTVLAMPMVGASDTDKTNFLTQLQSMAQAATAVQVDASCTVTPSVISVPSGASVVITNSGTQNISMQFGTTSVSAASSQPTTLSVGSVKGWYPVTCGGSVVGFYIVQ